MEGKSTVADSCQFFILIVLLFLSFSLFFLFSFCFLFLLFLFFFLFFFFILIFFSCFPVFFFLFHFFFFCFLFLFLFFLFFFYFFILYFVYFVKFFKCFFNVLHLFIYLFFAFLDRPFKVAQGQAWWCHSTHHIWFPIHLYSYDMFISHSLSLIATQNVLSYPFLLGSKLRKIESALYMTPNDLECYKVKGTPYMLNYSASSKFHSMIARV